MTGEVKFDEEGYFKWIKISLYKSVFQYKDELYYCFQVSISIISELKDTILFTIFESCIEQ